MKLIMSSMLMAFVSIRAFASFSCAQVYQGFDKMDVSLIERGLKEHPQCVEETDGARKTFLHYAASKNFPEAAELLLKYGAKTSAVDFNYDVPLNYAMKHLDLRVAQVLIAAGADVNFRFAFGSSFRGSAPIHWAAQQGNINGIKLLLQKGANVDLPAGYWSTASWEGDFATHVAVREGRLDVLEYLLDHGATLDPKTWHGGTPLVLSGGYQQLEIAKFLLKRGADTKATTKYGETALHKASCSYQADPREMIKLLVNAGLDINGRDNSGHTPLNWAKYCQSSKDVLDLIVSLGGYE